MLSAEWRTCYEAYLAHLYDLSHSEDTVNSYKSMLNRFFKQHPRPEIVSRAQVEHFLRTPADPHRMYPLSPRTRNAKLAMLRSFYKYAAEYVVHDASGVRLRLFAGIAPTSGIKMVKIQREPRRTFTMDELARFFAAIDRATPRGKRDFALFVTYLMTARRRGEICSLAWGDIFQGTVTDPDGTEREAWLYRWIGKGKGDAYDVAELPALAKEVIDTYLSASGRMETMEPDSPLFPSMPLYPGAGLPLDPWRSMTGTGVWVRFRKYLEIAGIDGRGLSPHSLRHTSARARYLIGRDSRAIQQLLRHENLMTTELYLAQITNPADPVAEELGERFRELLE